MDTSEIYIFGTHRMSFLFLCILQARRRGGSRGSNELPLVVNNGGLETQTAGFQLLANSEGLENNF